MKHSLVCFAMLFFGACNAPMSTTGADASLAKPTPEVRAMSAEPIEGESATGGQASLEWRQLAMKDENGWIDPQGLQRARSHRKANLDFAATDSGGGSSLPWVEQGPTNLAGRARSLVIHPTNPQRMYVGSCGGGVWRTDDGGYSWTPLDDGMGNLVVCTLAMDPNDPNVIYAGTGEGNFANPFPTPAVKGDGVWKTIDGGTTWTQLASTADWFATNHIAIHPNFSHVILAATSDGMHRSLDSGATWSKVLQGQVSQVLFDTQILNRCVCAYFSFTTGLRYIARSFDSGQNWYNAAAGYDQGSRIELAYAPSVVGRLYAATRSGGQLRCWRSDDHGASFVLRTTTSSVPGGQWGYTGALWVDPTNSSHVLLGDVSIWRSTDGAATFSLIGCATQPSNAPHVDQHGFFNHPGYNGSTNRTVYVCNDGGVYVAPDINLASVVQCTNPQGWQRLDLGLNTIQYYGVAGHSSGRLVGGTQDQGTHVINSSISTSMHRTAGGDGGRSQIDSTDPDYVYGSYQYLSPFRSTDGGQTISNMTTGLPASVSTDADSNFVAPLTLSPSNPNVLYGGSRSVWRCTNAKSSSPSWVQIKPPIASNSKIFSIAVAPTDANVVWVGYNDGTLHRSSNALAATPTWPAADPFNTVPDSAITRILIDRTTNSRVLVATGGYSASDPNLHLTTDGGIFFLGVAGSGATALPQAPIRGIAQHPSMSGRYYVATEVGVFRTADGFQTWSTSNEGPADVACYDISFLHGSETLLIGTYGRGMWTAEVREPDVTAFGAGCAGSNGTPTLTATLPRIGQDCTITGANMPPSSIVWLVQGQSRTSWFGNPLPADLALFQAPGCYLHVRPDIVRDSASDSGGTYTASLPIATNTGLLGQHIYLQAFPWDPTINGFGRTSSNGLDLMIGN